MVWCVCVRVCFACAINGTSSVESDGVCVLLLYHTHTSIHQLFAVAIFSLRL